MPDPALPAARIATRRVGRTFALACRLMPRAQRDDVYLLYLVFRTLDDLVDADDPRAEQRIAAVEAWCDRLPARSPEVDLLDRLDSRRSLPRAALRDFCAGMRDDLNRRPILTEQDLDDYCYRVAGTVGLVMASLLGVDDPERALPCAVALGQAMQRTNILRDIDEDAERGRVYLARETLERLGPALPGRREALLRDQLARADGLYERAREGIPLLRGGAYAVAAAAAMYRGILRQIERDGLGTRPGRAVVPARRKLLLVAGAGRLALGSRERRGRPRATAPAPAPDVRSARWRAPTYLALVGATMASVFAPGAVQTLLWLPLLAGLVFIGMPHGAVDHLVAGRVRGRPLGRRSMLALLLGYTALAAAGVALWLLAPAVAVVAFLAVAALHWGQGDIWFVVHGLGRARPDRPTSYAAVVLARGLLPVLGPILAHPRSFEQALGGSLAPFGAGSLVLAPHGYARGLLALLLAGALAAAAIASLRDGPGARRRDLGELAGLAVFVALTPPVLAIGSYFVAWHSVRHVARLTMLESSPRPLRKLARDAAPCSLLALTAVAVLGGAVAVDPTSAPALGGVALAVVFGLTLPHALIVAWMDRAQGLFGDGAGMRALSVVSRTSGPLPRGRGAHPRALAAPPLRTAPAAGPPRPAPPR